MTVARVILALAAEADDDLIWTRLGDIQSNMFAAGPVSIKFAYFGREGSLERRPFMSTRWATHAGDMQVLIDHARDRCVCGCYVNIGDVLVEALKETEQGSSIQAVVIIGDHFHGNRDDTLVYAKRLRAVGTRLFAWMTAPTIGHAAALPSPEAPRRQVRRCLRFPRSPFASTFSQRLAVNRPFPECV
jgi:hypothetical protein